MLRQKAFDDIMDGMAALISGQIDAVITAYPTALNVVKHNENLTLIPEPVDYENTSVAVKKGNDDLLQAVNEIIEKYKADGTFEDMKRRWLKKDLSPYETVEINLPTEGKILKVGTSATREPFCFVDENQKVTGHDGEFALRIAAELNRPIEFYDMKFSALINALQAGKVDLIVAGMTATAERAKSVNFTTSYFQNSQVMIVKKPSGDDNIVDAEELSGKMKVLDDITDRTVGVYAGTIHDNFVADNYPTAKISRYNSPADIILALKMGKVDAAFLDLVGAKVMLKSNPEIGILTEDALSLPLAVGFRKTIRKLREEFNQYLERNKIRWHLR
ncbi:MAG: transporter substrate-binding domain-containing protein [Melioribacteraceae bacterium]|nr:transporter substrate-binding domain-containing protein [Melioribacteraceae bacterium]